MIKISYRQMKQQIMEQFSNNFEELYFKNMINEGKFKPETPSMTELDISYPGYKTALKNANIIYDFRVNLYKDKKIYLPTHANIILDIYNKALHHNANIIENLIYDIATKGNDIDIEKYKDIDNKDMPLVSEDVFLVADVVHNSLNKNFNRDNNSWNYTIGELSFLVMWIALQEEINYPIEEGNDGLRMPFYRYLEAIHSAKNQDLEELAEVIKRSLVHYKPTLWDKDDLNYKPIQEIQAMVG